MLVFCCFVGDMEGCVCLINMGEKEGRLGEVVV